MFTFLSHHLTFIGITLGSAVAEFTIGHTVAKLVNKRMDKPVPKLSDIKSLWPRVTRWEKVCLFISAALMVAPIVGPIDEIVATILFYRIMAKAGDR